MVGSSELTVDISVTLKTMKLNRAQSEDLSFGRKGRRNVRSINMSTLILSILSMSGFYTRIVPNCGSTFQAPCESGIISRPPHLASDPTRSDRKEGYISIYIWMTLIMTLSPRLSPFPYRYTGSSDPPALPLRSQFTLILCACVLAWLSFHRNSPRFSFWNGV